MIVPIALAKNSSLQNKDNISYIINNTEIIKKLFFEIQQFKKENNNRLLLEKQGLYNKLLADADLSSLITISFPDRDIRLYNGVDFNNINKPILVRGIASSTYMNLAREKSLDFYFIETGYFGNYKTDYNPTAKKLFHRVVKNSMQHTNILNVSGNRWESLCKIDERLKWKNWKKSGSKILLVAPIDKSAGYYGYTKESWIKETVEKLQQHTDREIIIREKMSRPDRTFKKTIYQALDEDIFAVVTLNSIAATEAVAYGIPAFTTAPTAADPVCLKDLSKIETPYYPDENFIYKWCSSLAYGQFHLEEMITGDAWRMILENEQRETISY
jgi:hypothetical protein